MNLVNASPHTAIQPARRQRRPSHGAAAVNAAAIMPMPTAVGELAADKGPPSTVTATTWAPSGARLSCARSGTTTAARATPSSVVRAARRPLRTNVTTRPIGEHGEREDTDADRQDVDDPVRQRREAGEQFGHERDQGVTEQPLHGQQHAEHDEGDDQP